MSSEGKTNRPRQAIQARIGPGRRQTDEATYATDGSPTKREDNGPYFATGSLLS